MALLPMGRDTVWVVEPTANPEYKIKRLYYVLKESEKNKDKVCSVVVPERERYVF